MKKIFLSTMIVYSCLSLLLSNASTIAQTQDSDVIDSGDFFEANVRPLLIKHCISCHGPDNQEAGLRLDSRAAFMKGGESGSLVDPTSMDQSLLLRVVRYNDEIQMPPDGKLPEPQLASLQHWIQAGAAWPDSTAALSVSITDRIALDRVNHWSFKPIKKPEVPAVSDPNWQQNPVDSFIFSNLAEKQLVPSQPADDRTLFRRLYFDLLGLPASSAEIKSYIENPSPNKWSELVDQLLQRPEYGQRWARHWLDVARYADTQGYAFEADRRYPHAYTYRDYVIQSFNDDLPFDQFILQQLAADQMDLGDDNSELAALGFITVGRKFINGHDTIDDRIDVVTRGLMGLTVSCARCHDHKYDAIPTEDYYSLYGVFASTEEPQIKPVFGPKEKVEQRQAFENRQRELQGKLDGYRNEQVEKQKQFTRDRLQDYLFATVFPPTGMNVDQVDQRIPLSDENLRPRMVRRWRDRFHHYKNDQSNDTAAFRPFAHLMNLPEENFASAAQAQIEHWNRLLAADKAPIDAANASPEFVLNNDRMLPLIVERLKTAKLESKQDVANFYAELIRDVWKIFEENGSNDKAVLKVEAPLRLIIDLKRKPDSPYNIPAGEIGLYLSDTDFEHLQKLETELNQHNATAPPELPRAMAVNDREHMNQPYVFVRGSDGNRGPDVPRRYLALFSEADREPFPPNSSGRLQLAEKIVADDNPLTARVIANRVWMHHFGMPLVDTPSDFGVRCQAPIQEELLNYLAWYLQDQNWSIKSLHRLILNSKTFQQQSWNREDAYAVDPENRLYWRMNRRRMEWEALRDSLYAVCGQLDCSVGGPAVDMFRSQPSNRRSVYGTIDRQDLPNLLRSFDFASPDSSAARRPLTTVPQQSLFLMNGQMLSELSETMITQESFPPADQADNRLAWLFDRILQREMTPDEYSRCRQFMDTVELPTEGDDLEQRRAAAVEQRWKTLVQALLMTNEFAFVD